MEYRKVFSFIFPLPERIMVEIKKFKEFSEDKIGDFPSRRSKAHITICEPRLETFKVMFNMANRLEQELKTLPRIQLTIDGFSFFDNGSSGYVIYAKIKINDYLTNWFKALKLCFDDKTPINPHITIARGISAEQFKILWPHFQYFKYEREFEIDSVSILVNEIIKTRQDNILKNIALGDVNVVLRRPLTLFDQMNF